MGKKGFKDLMVWQRSKDLAVIVYKLTDSGKIAKDFGIRDQIPRSAVSIASNIAEGDERDTDKEAVRFFYIARGSIAELRTQLDIAFSINYISREIFEKIDNECISIGKMLWRLIQARSNLP